MGRKRRRRKLPPRQQPVVGDPFEDFMNDLLGQMKVTVTHGLKQILMPQTPMFQPPKQSEPEAKPAQVISVRTEK
jgi:hypothetical protein